MASHSFATSSAGNSICSFETEPGCFSTSTFIVNHCSGAQQAPQNLPSASVRRDPVYPPCAGQARVASLLRQSGEMRQHALPVPVALHENICSPLPRAEFLSHEFALRAGYCGDHCAISINADPEIFGSHHVVR